MDWSRSCATSWASRCAWKPQTPDSPKRVSFWVKSKAYGRF
jgi:hypothetical protein